MLKEIMIKVGKVIIIIIGILAIISIISYSNHRININRESELFKPLGEMVSVNGHDMQVYTEGEGLGTLVFMSGGGTCSPTLDFRSLYSNLSDEYSIAVVEKAGYGFSEVVDTPRDIDSILEETREALTLAGVEAPYILFPHSMSGIEALYWAQKYPNEIDGIVGLDPAVPEDYKNYPMPNKILLSLSVYAARIGFTRFIPSVCNSSSAIKDGTLTDDEKDIYRAVFYKRTASKTMIKELDSIKESAYKVSDLNIPQVPMLFFISNGNGTGTDKKEWQDNAKQFIDSVPKGQYVSLDSNHYVHNYRYDEIALKSKEFINEILKEE